MNSSQRYNRTISVMVDSQIFQLVDLYAKKTGKPKTEVVRNFIIFSLSNLEQFEREYK